MKPTEILRGMCRILGQTLFPQPFGIVGEKELKAREIPPKVAIEVPWDLGF